MSLLSLCVISSILRGLPHWPLLAGLLIPGFGTRASNDVSQILATTRLDRFAAPEPPPVEFDLNRPQGQLKSVLFVVVRDKGHFPIENIQITVGTIGGSEATQQADEGWAAFELGRNGPFQGSIHVTVSGPLGLVTAEELEGATIDMALALDESTHWEKHFLSKQDCQRGITEPVFLHCLRLNVEKVSLNSSVSARSNPIPILLATKGDLVFRGFEDFSGGITGTGPWLVAVAQLGPTDARLAVADASGMTLAISQIVADSSNDILMGPFVTECRVHLQEAQLLPHAIPRCSPASEILFDHKAASRDLLSLSYISKGAVSAEMAVFQFWGLRHID